MSYDDLNEHWKLRQISRESDSEGSEGDSSGSGDDFFINSGHKKGKNNYSLYELKQLEELERLNGKVAEEALFDIRIGVRAQGIDVTALTKSQKLRQEQQNRLQNNEGGGGLGLESHPELADMGGEADPNHIVLPESEELEHGSARNDPKLQHKHKQKMAAKFGMGGVGGLSKEALEQEYKKKMRIREAPKQEPRFRAQETPKNKPT